MNKATLTLILCAIVVGLGIPQATFWAGYYFGSDRVSETARRERWTWVTVDPQANGEMLVQINDKDGPIAHIYMPPKYARSIAAKLDGSETIAFIGGE